MNWGCLLRATGTPSVSPTTDSANVMTITTAAVWSQATTVRGELGSKAVNFMLDSGSSVSLVESNTLLYCIVLYKLLYKTFKMEYKRTGKKKENTQIMKMIGM